MKNRPPAIAIRDRSSGAGWVVVQILLLAALAVAAPLWRGHWPLVSSMGLGIVILCYATWTGLHGVRGLGRNLTPLPVPRAGGELITTGIYARLRHPLYASVMAMGLGWASLWSSFPALGIALLLVFFLHAKTLHEERLLREKFAGYNGYSASVPRYFPRLTQTKTRRTLS
jgi:protein-S-isoprenylcysteine O-methyltransferase Ste14